MSSGVVRPLRDVRLRDAAEVGGKAGSLGELLADGVRVPDGVVLGLAIEDMPAKDRAALVRAAVHPLGAGPFAVRSSAIAEDGEDRSFAGVFESSLDVSGDDVSAATERCLASARSARAADYDPGSDGRMAVIIQHMIHPAAAGVALTADPINGDRRSCVITAVRGTGERLVGGAALGDEWVVDDRTARARRLPERAIARRQAERVAMEARRIAIARGTPQDIEWAIDEGGTLWILQARPMTALPPDVSWDAPAPGAYTRMLRLGEWISEPVTPLFESWLLTTLEERLHANLMEWIGQRAPRPYHVVVNGWYFYSISWLSGRALTRNLPRLVWHLVRAPRRVAGLIPPTVRHSVPIFEREWREDLDPRYRAAVAAAEARVETIPVGQLSALIDELAGLAGDSFASITALSGAAYKFETNLARFHRRRLRASGVGSHLELLAGLEAPSDPPRHAVASLDWWHQPSPAIEPASTAGRTHNDLVEARHAAEAAAFESLTKSPRRLGKFRRLLAETQRLARVREQQVAGLTIAWPVMRRAVFRIGDALVKGGTLSKPDDVFFLTRAEALEALQALGEGFGSLATVDTARRRAELEKQSALVPPIFVGRVNRVMNAFWNRYPQVFGAARSERALVSGTPAAPGRVAGAVRVIRGPQAFDQLQEGEVLVAPLTAPAWAPLFTRAAAVVTDVGSPASHASIIAREYGIPAVVGCVDATSRLRSGVRVVVDGSTGNVEPE